MVNEESAPEVQTPCVYECSGCDNVVLAIQPCDLDCCDGEMERVESIETGIREPELKRVLNQVFGMSDVEKEMCVYLMSEGDSTIPEIAESFDLDRSSVSRYVNHLVDIGVLQKSTRNLKEGGHINVYSHHEPRDVQRIFKLGLYRWAAMAMELVDEMNREKFRATIDAPEEEERSLGVYWDG